MVNVNDFYVLQKLQGVHSLDGCSAIPSEFSPSSTFKVTHILTGCCVFFVLLISWSAL